MRVISFDVGIKNMAYCIFETEPFSIIDWNVISLKDEIIQNNFKCTCSLIQKKKNSPIKVCNNNAKYFTIHNNNTNYYCDKHAKSNTDYLIPKREHSISYIKKQKIDNLKQLCYLYKLDIQNMNKENIINVLNNYYTNKSYKFIEKSKEVSTGDMDLITIGKNLKRELNKIPIIETVTHVIIENQISPIANRMKTIQGMLAQYFIMKNENIQIEFISSINKLKDFYIFNKNSKTETSIESNTEKKTEYKKHKNDGVLFCSQIISANPCIFDWKNKLDTNKKDDLADAFLQGIWFIKHKKIITYAENLKINSVYLT